MFSIDSVHSEVVLTDAHSFSPLRNMWKRRLIAEAMKRGATQEQAEDAITQAEGDRPLLDWLINGGFQKILEFIMSIIALMPKAQAL